MSFWIAVLLALNVALMVAVLAMLRRLEERMIHLERRRRVNKGQNVKRKRQGVKS